MIELADITRILQENAVVAVFVNVLLQQLGLPIPVVPTLLLAGSLATGVGPLTQLLAATVVASVIADCLWYWAGKSFGYRVLSTLCKFSINPASCVSQTEARFLRWGLASLVVAKFIPGFSTVAPPIAGVLHMSLSGFVAAASLGAVIWAGVAIGAGWMLRDAVPNAIAMLDHNSGTTALLVTAVLVAFLAWKLWQKYRFKRFCAVPHITPSELLELMESDSPPLLLDLRSATMIADAGHILGAVAAEHDYLSKAVGDWPKDLPIVTLCACPEDAGAVQAARQLLNDGFLSVRPLQGGYDAWVRAVRHCPTPALRDSFGISSGQ